MNVLRQVCYLIFVIKRTTDSFDIYHFILSSALAEEARTYYFQLKKLVEMLAVEYLQSVKKLQTLFPFFVAGLGQICTGLLFEQAQYWWFFLHVPEAFILVPALLGLKGNLEVTYASRFCTLVRYILFNKTGPITDICDESIHTP